MSALITQYSSANRVVDSALSVSYFKRLVQGSWTGTTLVTSSASKTYTTMHEYHRVAKKTYKYVGMTEAAAKTCARAMVSLYTRTVRYQEWDSTAGSMGDWVELSATATEVSADISAQHVDGEMWQTVISVNEDSTYMAKTDTPKLPSVIFATERARSYDDETETTT